MKYVLILIAAVLTASCVFSQEENGTNVGLGASIQNNQFDVTAPIRVSKELSFLPSLALIVVEDVGDEFGLLGNVRYYFNRSVVSPYLSLRGGVFRNKLKGDKALVDYVAGTSVGGECFINKQFSLGIDAQLNYSKSDKGSGRFGNSGGYVINLATVVMGIIYF